MDNTLALFEQIYRQAYRYGTLPELNRELAKIAKEFGLSDGDIYDAIYSDRGLVIYEP